MDLRQSRKVANLKQSQLAEKIGISQTAFSQIETGRRYPRKSTRDKIEQILGMRVDWYNTRMQIESITKRRGVPEDIGLIPAEEVVIEAIQNYIKSGHIRERGERFQFLRDYLEKFQDALIKEQEEREKWF